MLQRMQNSELKTFIEDHQRLFVRTGAGCSTDSGIPDYRDGDGNWKRAQPVRFQAFMAEEMTRRRYWARSIIGWRRFGHALPNDAHHALARLEAKIDVGFSLPRTSTGCTKPPGAGR
jgi:NAD-dependent SIR2 family protein deacetylase